MLARATPAELARIPSSQRVAFELLRVDGLSHDEAAQVLGTTVNAVKLRAFRAYSALRAVLGHPFDSRNAEQECAASCPTRVS